MKKFWLPSILLLFLSLFWYCSTSNKPDVNKVNSDLPDANEADHQNKLKKMFYHVPNIIELSNLLKESGIRYEPALVNPTINHTKYQTDRFVAINIGVYGADLGYLHLFNQSSETIQYFAIINKLSNKLGIPVANEMQKTDVSSFEAKDTDTLIQKVTLLFASIDGYLNENSRGQIAALVVMGGWVETMYLAAKLSDKIPSLDKVIVEQTYSLEVLIDLLKVYENNSDVKPYLINLELIHSCYQQLDITIKSEELATDTLNHYTDIHIDQELKANQKTMANIKNSLMQLRLKMIN